MTGTYEIAYTDEPAWNIIGGGISEYNEQQAGKQHGKLLCFVVRAPDGNVPGGVIGETHWDWLYVNLM
mgnify:CR=1 FL=1